MQSYILFVFGLFEDFEDVEYFCTQIMSDNDNLKSLRFVVEREQNIIIIFESDLNEDALAEELYKFLDNDNIKFYFLFQKDAIITANIPKEIKSFIMNDKLENTLVQLEYEKIVSPKELSLDSVLDKIKEHGIDSLTSEEKKFLDNFEN